MNQLRKTIDLSTTHDYDCVELDLPGDSADLIVPRVLRLRFRRTADELIVEQRGSRSFRPLLRCIADGPSHREPVRLLSPESFSSVREGSAEAAFFANKQPDANHWLARGPQCFFGDRLYQAYMLLCGQRPNAECSLWHAEEDERHFKGEFYSLTFSFLSSSMARAQYCLIGSWESVMGKPRTPVRWYAPPNLQRP